MSETPQGFGLRVVVTGGRDYRKAATVYAALDGIHGASGISRIAFGDAIGADAYAWAWAVDRGVEHERYVPDWKRLGRAAGPIRNGQMLDAEAPDLVVAFAGGPGTADCVRQAKKRGIRIAHIKDLEA